MALTDDTRPGRPETAFLAMGCGLVAAMLGATVLAGWLAELPTLRNLGFGAAMRANAALAFLGCGMAVAMLAQRSPGRALRLIAAGAGAAVAAFAIATLAQDLLGVNFAIDEALVRDPIRGNLNVPGRMSPPTAFGLALCGMAVALAALPKAPSLRQPLLPALGATVALVGGISVAGHLLRAVFDLHFLSYSRIAPAAAFCLLLLGTALVLLARRARPLRWALDRVSGAGFFAGLAAMVISAGLTYHYTLAMRDDANRLQQALQRLREIQNLSTQLADFTLGTGRFIITRDDRALEDRGATKGAIAGTLVRLRRLEIDAGFRARLDELERLHGRRIALSDAIIARFRDGLRAGRLPGLGDPPILGAEYPALGEQVDRLVEQMEADGYADLARRQVQAAAATTRTLLLLPLGVLVGMALLVTGLFFLNAAEAARRRGEEALRRSAERLSLLHEIDQLIIAARTPKEIAASVLPRLRDLLQTPRIAVSLVDPERREATWLAAVGRRRAYDGPGFRYPAEFLGDPAGLARGEVQFLDATAFGERPEARALSAAGVSEYMVVPMVAGGRLVGALSFGGQRSAFPADTVQIASEVAAQLAIALHGAMLRETASIADARFRATFESAPVGISVTTFEGRVLATNPALYRLLGHASMEDMIASMQARAHAIYPDPQAREDYVARVREGGEAIGFETRLRRADGSVLWVSLTGCRIDSREGEPPLLVTMVEDITERREQANRIARLSRVKEMHARVNSAVVRQRDRNALLAEICRIAVEAGGLRAAWVSWHEAGERRLVPVAEAGELRGFVQGLQYGTGEAPPPGVPTLQVFYSGESHVTDDIRTVPELQQREEALARGFLSMMHLPLKSAGSTAGVLVLCAGEPQAFDEEERRRLDGLAADVSFALDSIEKSERLDYLAYYDPVTRLPNRRLFENRLQQSLRTRGGDALIAVALFDVERFRRINATLGREAGDLLLAQVGRRFSEAQDGVARLGNDVFGLVLRGARRPAQVMRALEDILAAALGAGFDVGGEALRVSCRAGVAVYPADGADEHALLRNAEAALRRAKEVGEPIVFYAPEMNARVSEALAIENRLRLAVERREFVLHYQPKIHLVSGAVTGLEALLRWQPPGEALVPPGKFIPVLEETGMIVEVGRWAVTQAGLDQASWTAAGLAAPAVAVNVSAVQLHRRSFVDEMIDAIMAGGDRPEALELEITESLAMRDVEQTIRKLTILRGMGVRVAIDDFGTGYSSLSYLSRLPVDVLKVDRSFVSGVAVGGQGEALVSSVVALAHGLKLKVVAEGVEQAGQAAVLRRLGCDEAQGYYFSRPIPAGEVGALLRKHGRMPARSSRGAASC